MACNLNPGSLTPEFVFSPRTLQPIRTIILKTIRTHSEAQYEYVPGHAFTVCMHALIWYSQQRDEAGSGILPIVQMEKLGKAKCLAQATQPVDTGPGS